jgi:VWFA-related protein
MAINEGSAAQKRDGHGLDLKRLLALIAAYALVCWPAMAESPAAAGSGTEPDTHTSATIAHTATENITIDMVVRDKKSRPVENLAATDISVSDAGTPVQLSELHRLTAQSGGGARIALVFDRMSPEAAKVAGSLAGKLLQMAPPKCSFAVLGVEGRLRLFQNYSQDRGAVTTAIGTAMEPGAQNQIPEAEKQLLAIERTGTLGAGRSVSVEERAQARMMVAVLEEAVRAVQDEHAPPALAGLLAMAKAQQNLPGRKIVVFFSAGLRAGASSEAMSKEVVEAANRAGIGFYTMDTSGVQSKSFDLLTMMAQGNKPLPVNSASPKGMLPGINVPMLSVAAIADGASPTSSENPFDRDRRSSAGDSLALLAVGTGGFAIRAGDGNLNKSLQRLVDDVSDYYEATYTSNLKDYDGQFHSIDIHSLRKGVSIRSRAGYFALPPDAVGEFGVQPFEAPLLKALGVAQPTDEIGFRQAVLRWRGNAAGTESELVIEVPVSRLQVHQDQRTLLYAAHLQVLAQVKDSAGVVVERFSEDMERNGALETVDAFRASAITLQRHFRLAPGSYVLEAIVFDLLGAKAGVQRSEFAVSGQADGPALSDIALVRSLEPFGSAPDSLDPMQYNRARVVPNLTLEVEAGTPRISFFFSIHPQADGAGEGKLDMEVQREGKTISRSSMPIARGAQVEDLANLPTILAGALPAGSYRAVFTYAQGDKSVARDVAFNVVGNNPTETAPSAELAKDSAGTGTALADPGDFAPGRFTAPPPTGATGPDAGEANALLTGARKRALGYLDSLVNFKCIEVTDRLGDPKGAGSWLRHDQIAELLTYENRQESRSLLAVNGNSGADQSVDMKGARLEGEFGGVLEIVFDPAAKTEFTWKETDALDGAAVQVFSYRVDAKNSKFAVVALPHSSEIVGFHGLVYIDSATYGVRRVVMDAEGIPADSAVRASGLTIDYDYIAINNHDYLMPVRGELRMKMANTAAILHRIEFRDYHRFGSAVRIVGVNP